MLPVEQDRWLVSLAGYFDEQMPKNHPEFLAFARSLPVPDLYNAVMAQEPLSEIVWHGFPGSRRRRYDLLKRVPGHLIVLGDALCCFNPVYGQGITVAALEAEQLGAAVAAAKTTDSLGTLSAEWFGRIRPIVDSAWDGVRIEDSRFPELSRGRSPRLKASQWYVGRLHRASYCDSRITDQFYRVLSFIDPPSSLFKPRVALSALFARGPARNSMALPRRARTRGSKVL
jgi:2-polyprenyl-6-methoxyphenol hydroxylase-like FAD-dependent oxidoreductase